MGLLGDIGRSNLGQASQTMLGDVRGFAMDQSAMETQRLQQQRLQQEQDQYQKDNTPLDYKSALSMFPEHFRPHVEEAWKTAGVINPAGTIFRKDARNTLKMLEENTKVAIAINQSQYAQNEKQIQSLAKKGDEQSMAEAIRLAGENAAIEKTMRLGKDKLTTLVPKGTKGTIENGVYKPLDASGDAPELGEPVGKTAGDANNPSQIAYKSPDGAGIILGNGDNYQPDYHGELTPLTGPKDANAPTTIREFEAVYPQFEGKRGTPEYTKGYEKFLELKGNRINAVTYLGQNDQGDFIVGKTRGVGAGGTPQVVKNPAGGQLQPNVVRPLAANEQEKFIGASNIAHVLPDMIPFRDLVRAKGGPIIDQVRGKAAEKMIDAGMGEQTGLPKEAIDAHVAVTHLKTWATGMLKGAGSDVQRKQLIDTLPTLYDSADIIDAKMRKTIQIVRNIASNTVKSAAAGGKAIPPEFYQQMADMEKFASQLGGAGSGQLSKEEAMSYLKKANGNKEKARKMAAEDGRTF